VNKNELSEKVLAQDSNIRNIVLHNETKVDLKSTLISRIIYQTLNAFYFIFLNLLFHFEGAKQQALEIVPKLREKIPLSRAQMRLKIVVPMKDLNKLNKKIKTMKLTKESEEKDAENMTLIFLVDPGEYRNLDEIVKNDTQGRGQLEILSLKEFDDSEQQLGT
jgi:ribosome maturation protein Sdo1